MRMQLTQALAAFLIGETRKCRKLCSSSQSGKSCSTSRKELKNCVSEATVTSWRRPKPCPSPQESECQSCNIDMLLTEKYLTQLSRRPPPPCEAPAYSWQQPCAVSDLSDTRQHARMEVILSFSSKNLTTRLEKPTLGKESPRFRIVWIESAGPGAILTRSILTRLMRKFMRIAMETVIV